MCAACKTARAAPPSSKRVKREPESSPEIKLEPKIKLEPEIKQEPFTIRGYFRFDDGLKNTRAFSFWFFALLAIWPSEISMQS